MGQNTIPDELGHDWGSLLFTVRALLESSSGLAGPFRSHFGSSISHGAGAFDAGAGMALGVPPAHDYLG